jgi:hypothetical protein
MRCDTPVTLSPPWGSVPAWHEANRSLDFHINRYYLDLKPVIQIARDMRICLESIVDSIITQSLLFMQHWGLVYAQYGLY